VAQIQIGHELRRGVSELDGEGEVTGGIVVIRYGANALRTISGVKAKLKDLQAGLPPGVELVVTYDRSGLIQRAKQRFMWIVPLTLLLVMALLYQNFRNLGKAFLILACLPLSLAGGFWLVYWLDYRFSVAVMVGFIALAGVAVQFGLVMLPYLDQAIAEFTRAGRLLNREDLRHAIVQGALLRIRPKMMTASVILAGLIPVMPASGAGADVMKRIAAPLVGGMVTAPLLSLILIPVGYVWWQGKSLPAPPETQPAAI